MSTYNTNVYLETGGDKLVVASGGEVEVQAGGTIDFQANVTLLDDVAIVLGTGSDCSLEWDTAQTQDCLQLGLGASRTLMIMEKADMSADKALAASTYPQIIVYDADADNYMTLGSSGDDIALVGSSNDLDIRCGLVATDALNLQAYDVGAGAYEDMVTLASHATLPTMVLHATGGTTINAGLTLSDAAGTGAAVIGGVAGQNMTMTSGNDLLLQSGPLAADVAKLQAYDVGAGAYEDIVTATAHATLPTLILHATGGTTINSGLTLSDAAGTGAAVVGCVAGQDLTVTAGNDMVLQSGPLAADVVKIQAYDVGITTYEDIITASAHATLPTLVLHATGGTTINSGLTLSDAAGTGPSVVGCVAGQDITVTAGNDMVLQSGPVAADVVKIQAYDVGITTYEDIITASAHATDPTLILHATGGTTINSGLTLSDAAGTGPSVIGAVAGQDVTLTSGNDLVLQSGPLAADLVTIQAYDVGAGAYETLISGASHATLPTLTLAATGGATINAGLTLSDAAGTGASLVGCVAGQDMTVTAGNDLVLQSGPLAADLVKIQAYDVGAVGYEDIITASAHATLPTLVLHATGGTTINSGLTLSDAAGTGASVIGCVAGQDITVTAGNDMVLQSGPVAADVVKIQAYDVGITTYEDIITASAHATDPTLVLHATGGTTINSGLTLSDAAGTGGAVVGCVAAQDITVTAGNDMVLRSGPLAADVVKIQAYDVGITTYEDIITASAHATTPTLVLHATGGTTINSAVVFSDAAGTGAADIDAVAGQDMTITSGNDLVLQSGPLAADLVTIQAYDVGAVGYETVFSAAAHATLPTLTLAASGGITMNLGDNLATGLDIQEAANDYITCVTTDDFEEVEFGVPVDMERGRKVSTYFEIFDDFVYQTIAETDTPWILNSGTDTEAIDAAILAAQENGVIRLTTGNVGAGAVAADGTQIVCSIPMQADNGGLVFETRLNIDTAITDISVNAGFTDTTALEEPFTIAAGTYTSNASNAAVFVYDTDATADNFHMCAVDTNQDDAGNADTGTAPVADIFSLLRIEVSADGATIKYFIDGVLEGTLSGSFGVSPTTNLYATVVANATTTTSKSVDIDYIMASVVRG